jgi:hypothetical protein
MKQAAVSICLSVKCSSFQVPLCRNCYEKAHTTFANEPHQHVEASKCLQCTLEEASFWCVECDLRFCTTCFETIHQKNPLKRRSSSHRRMKIQGIYIYIYNIYIYIYIYNSLTKTH